MTKESLYELQKIDANCNDCRYMLRDLTRPPRKGAPCPTNYGHCNKFDKEVMFTPGLCSLDTQECFVHRRDKA